MKKRNSKSTNSQGYPERQPLIGEGSLARRLTDADEVESVGLGNSESPLLNDDLGKGNFRKISNASSHRDEGDDAEPWLISYADMVTLLMCFFILFFQLDKSKYAAGDPERVKEKLESLIGLDMSIMRKSKAKQTAEEKVENRSIAENIKGELKSITKEARVMFTIVEPEPGVLEIVFLQGSFFKPLQAELTAEAKRIIKKIAPKLLDLGTSTEFEVEGHTDSDPVKSGRYPTNWELSSARASSVVRELVLQGIDPARLRVSAYGQFRPLAKETDELGVPLPSIKKMNRRVVIRARIDRI